MLPILQKFSSLVLRFERGYFWSSAFVFGNLKSFQSRIVLFFLRSCPWIFLMELYVSFRLHVHISNLCKVSFGLSTCEVLCRLVLLGFQDDEGNPLMIKIWKKNYNNDFLLDIFIVQSALESFKAYLFFHCGYSTGYKFDLFELNIEEIFWNVKLI